MLTVQPPHAMLTVQPADAMLTVQPPHAMLTMQCSRRQHDCAVSPCHAAKGCTAFVLYLDVHNWSSMMYNVSQRELVAKHAGAMGTMLSLCSLGYETSCKSHLIGRVQIRNCTPCLSFLVLSTCGCLLSGNKFTDNRLKRRMTCLSNSRGAHLCFALGLGTSTSLSEPPSWT